MQAVDNLIKLGYQFSITEDSQLECIHRANNKLNPTETISLFEELKSNKENAIQYLKMFIVISIDFKEVRAAKIYSMLISEYLGKFIKSYQVEKTSMADFAIYMNKLYIDNQRFHSILFSVDKTKRVGTYIAEDRNRINDVRQLGIEDITEQEALACPW